MRVGDLIMTLNYEWNDVEKY